MTKAHLFGTQADHNLIKQIPKPEALSNFPRGKKRMGEGEAKTYPIVYANFKSASPKHSTGKKTGAKFRRLLKCISCLVDLNY